MALPTATSMPIADESPEATQYKEAITSALNSLGNRNQTNWFSIAGQLLNPGRTGNAGEAFGRTADVVGQQLEQQRKEQPSIAMLRAQLAGTNYQLTTDTKAMDALTKIMGAPTAANAVEKLQSGDIDLTTANKLAQSMPLFINSPKVAGLVKSVIEAQTSVAKANADVTQAQTGQNRFRAEYDPTFSVNNGSAAPTAPTFQLPVQGGTITSPYGNRPDPFNKEKTEFHQGIDIGGKEGSPVTSVISGVVSKVEKSPDGFGNRVLVTDPKTGYTTYYAHLADASVKEGQEIKAGSPVGILGSTGKSTGPHVEFGVLTPEGKHADPSQLFNRPAENRGVQVASNNERLPGESLKTQQERIAAEGKSNIELSQKMQLEREKAPQAQMDEISSLGNYKAVSYNNNQLADLTKLIKNNRDTVDLMNKNGVLSVVGALVQNGVSIPWGSVSADVNSAIQKSLPLEKQAIARQISQYIYEQNQMIMKAGKSIYGPQISNADAVLMSKPGFAPEDPSAYILNMTAKMRLTNQYNSKIADKMDDWVHDHPKESSRNFFKSRDYRDTVDEFNVMHKNLLKGLNYGQ